MLLLPLSEASAPWLAPYAYGIVLLGFIFFLYRILEFSISEYLDRPLFRHFFVYKKLSPPQTAILQNEFEFYNSLSQKHKRQFSHRMAYFISEKKFVGREGLQVSEQMKVLIAAVACMLSFGRKNYTFGLVEGIIIYPEAFFSTINQKYHKGEFNPKEQVVVLSWKDFKDGLKKGNDNLNVGIHEFMHAMQLEAKTSKDIDSARYKKHFQAILQRLTNQEVRLKLNETNYFREYAFTNQYEFMAVLSEYFFESPKDFKGAFPEIYAHLKKLLNFNFAGY